MILNMLIRLLLLLPILIWFFAVKKWKEASTEMKPLYQFLIFGGIFCIIELGIAFVFCLEIYPSGDYANPMVIFMPVGIVWATIGLLGVYFYFKAVAQLNKDKES